MTLFPLLTESGRSRRGLVEGLKPFSNQNFQLDPWLVDGLVFAWDHPQDRFQDELIFSDGFAAEIAHRAYQIQYNRFRRTGILTAVGSLAVLNGHAQSSSESKTITDTPLQINQPLNSHGLPFPVYDVKGIPQPSLAGLSTRATFFMNALWQRPYSQLLMEAVGDTYSASSGFPDGVFTSSRGEVSTKTLRTNAAVLMALAYKYRGPLLPIRNSNMVHFWDKVRQKPKFQVLQCLPKPARPQVSGFAQDPGFGFTLCEPVTTQIFDVKGAPLAVQGAAACKTYDK